MNTPNNTRSPLRLQLVKSSKSRTLTFIMETWRLPWEVQPTVVKVVTSEEHVHDLFVRYEEIRANRSSPQTLDLRGLATLHRKHSEVVIPSHVSWELSKRGVALSGPSDSRPPKPMELIPGQNIERLLTVPLTTNDFSRALKERHAGVANLVSIAPGRFYDLVLELGLLRDVDPKRN